MGSIIKVVVEYATRWWAAEGFSGQMVSDTGPVTMFIDHCLPGTPHAVTIIVTSSMVDNSYIGLVGFICGRDARRFGAMTVEERRAAVIGQLSGMAQKADARNFVAYHEYDWNTDAFARGCYTGVMGPGVLTHHAPLVDLLRAGHGNVQFAATELSAVWCGYMEGAVLAGRDAAQRLLHSLK